MQFSVLKANGRNLARGCAMLLVAGAISGCSSQVARFGEGLDSVATASTSNQRSIIDKQPVSQPFPGDTQVSAAPADGSYSRSVGRSSLEPVSVQPLPPVAQAQPASDMAPVARNVDRTTTGTVGKPFKSAERDAPRMANAGGEPRATQIVVRDGQTLSGLSREYHVPASAIMAANGLSETNGLKTGQKIVIPAYAYSTKSAPDGMRNLADADVSHGKRQDGPADKPRLPSNAPFEKVAVLPQQPKLKEDKAVAQVDASGSADQPKAKIVASAGASGTYTVQSGDTLSAIARKSGVGVVALKQANGMQDGLLRVGQTLKIPAGGTATVASAKPEADPFVTSSTGPAAKDAAATKTLAAYTPPVKNKVLEQAEDDQAVAPDSTGIGKMRWPVRGRVIANFGSGGDNGDGIDISVPEGTPVKAAENGVVIYAGDGLKEFGNTVLVRHEDGLVTVYGHASSLEVTRGQKVKRGQEIALSGMSGTTDSPKLHFEVRKNSAPVNPSGYLE